MIRLRYRLALHVHLEISLDDVEYRVIVDVRDRHEVAQLLPGPHPPHPLAPHGGAGDAAIPQVTGPFLTYDLAGVEEASHGRANGSDSAATSPRGHGARGKSEFLCVGSINVETGIFLFVIYCGGGPAHPYLHTRY